MENKRRKIIFKGSSRTLLIENKWKIEEEKQT